MTFKITTNSGLYIEGDVTKVDDGGVQSVCLFPQQRGDHLFATTKIRECLKHSDIA